MKRKENTIAKRTEIIYSYTVNYYSTGSCDCIALAKYASLAEALKHTRTLLKYYGFDVTLRITQKVDEGKVLHEYEKAIYYDHNRTHIRLSGYTFVRAIKRPHNPITRTFWH